MSHTFLSAPGGELVAAHENAVYYNITSADVTSTTRITSAQLQAKVARARLDLNYFKEEFLVRVLYIIATLCLFLA